MWQLEVLLHTEVTKLTNTIGNMEARNKSKLLVELQLKSAALTKKDIRDWRNAWQMAINVEQPNRVRLYDIYNDVITDGHISGAIEQRKRMAMQQSFKIVDVKTGEEIPEFTQALETTWFKNLVDLILDSKYYGHSLIELGDVIQNKSGARTFEYSKLVPRKHVIPEYGVITPEPGDEPKNGMAWRDDACADYLIEAGNTDNLGLLLKCAPHQISKKNMAAFWDQFGEMFGMPMRIAKTSTRDAGELSRIDTMMESMGPKQWGRFNEDTDIEFRESSTKDAYNVYDKRIDRCNNELSKILIGQTMTMDDGASLSQSEVHLEILNRLVASDCDMLRDVINDQLIPRCQMHGIFDSRQVRFDWDDTLNLTPEQQIKIEQMLINKYDIDEQYFIEKYNVPITGKVLLPTGTSMKLNDFFQ